MKKTFVLFITLLALLAMGYSPALAQESDYHLNISRNFGFSSGSQIRGTFTISVIGPVENVRQVTFIIDDQVMATVSEPPFQYKYHTDDFGTGWHTYTASVELTDGSVQTTDPKRYQSVTSEEEMAVVQRIIIPLFGGILLLMVIGMGVQFLFLRGQHKPVEPGTARTYGMRGGTICPRCQRPFPIHWWAMNLGPMAVESCEHCGRTGLFKRYSMKDLRAAEAAEIAALATSGTIVTSTQESEEDALRKQLEESRYTDPSA